MVMELEDLAKLYEAKRDKLHMLHKEVLKLQFEYDSKREFDKNWVWCYTCRKKHHPWSRIYWRHRTVKIPKQCLTKYDHIYDSTKAKKVRKEYQEKLPNCFVWIFAEKCIVCGHTREVSGSFIETEEKAR